MLKRFRKSKEARDRRIAQCLGSILLSLQKKLRIKQRIAVLNRYAQMHKAATLGWTVGILLASLAVGTALNFSHIADKDEDTDVLGMGAITPVRGLFDGFHRIQGAKGYQQRQFSDMVADGQALKHDLDSLARLPVKTHADSLAILTKYRQLEYIANTLQNNQQP